MHRVRMELGSFHAEEVALRKLPWRRGENLRVDLVVIRTTRGGKLAQSRPCIHCISALSRWLPQRGYKLDTIYYSNERSELTSARLSELAQTPPHYTQYYKDRCRRGCPKSHPF